MGRILLYRQYSRIKHGKGGGAFMKWILGISLAVVILTLDVSAYAGWNYEEHDYHVNMCSRMRLRAWATDTPNCENHRSGTSYDCCCDTCDTYLKECLDKEKLPQATCEGIRVKCARDCNVFASSQSANK
jgi:hypothetical protein